MYENFGLPWSAAAGGLCRPGRGKGRPRMGGARGRGPPRTGRTVIPLGRTGLGPAGRGAGRGPPGRSRTGRGRGPPRSGDPGLRGAPVLIGIPGLRHTVSTSLVSVQCRPDKTRPPRSQYRNGPSSAAQSTLRSQSTSDQCPAPHRGAPPPPHPAHTGQQLRVQVLQPGRCYTSFIFTKQDSLKSQMMDNFIPGTNPRAEASPLLCRKLLACLHRLTPG